MMEYKINLTKLSEQVSTTHHQHAPSMYIWQKHGKSFSFIYQLLLHSKNLYKMKQITEKIKLYEKAIKKFFKLNY